jgi:septum formation protein
LTKKIYLASRSPRRRQLLQQIGVEFEIIDINIDESWRKEEQPRQYVQRMALEKAQAAKSKISDRSEYIVLAADTTVVLDNNVLGKAENEMQAREMLQLLSGRKHYVHTAVAKVTGSNEQVLLNTNAVCFKILSESEIMDYCKTGEPIGKAGGYAIQGKAAIFIERLEGSYSGVMGLPLFETGQLLNRKIMV